MKRHYSSYHHNKDEGCPLCGGRLETNDAFTRKGMSNQPLDPQDQTLSCVRCGNTFAGNEIVS